MTYYSLQGTDGCYEAARGLGDQPKIWLRAKSEQVEWAPLEQLADEFLPDEWRHPSKEQLEAGHGGGDFLEVQDFVRAILQDRQPPIGIHEAMDMTSLVWSANSRLPRDRSGCPCRIPGSGKFSAGLNPQTRSGRRPHSTCNHNGDPGG